MARRSLKDRVLRVSEIGQYVYCQRSWWLERVGVENLRFIQANPDMAREEMLEAIQQGMAALDELDFSADSQAAHAQKQARLDAGTQFHREHGQEVQRSRSMFWVGVAIILLVLILFFAQRLS